MCMFWISIYHIYKSDDGMVDFLFDCDTFTFGFCVSVCLFGELMGAQVYYVNSADKGDFYEESVSKR